jgi:hypothetical protein
VKAIEYRQQKGGGFALPLAAVAIKSRPARTTGIAAD